MSWVFVCMCVYMVYLDSLFNRISTFMPKP